MRLLARVDDQASERDPAALARRSLVWAAWLLPGLAVTLFCMRFAMRAAGVRDDIPIPGLIYAMTAPFVTPFYAIFPVSPRFDYHAVEWASLAAAATVVAIAMLVCAVVLLLSERLSVR